MSNRANRFSLRVHSIIFSIAMVLFDLHFAMAQEDNFSLDSNINANNANVIDGDQEDDGGLFDNEALDFPLETSKNKAANNAPIPASIPPANAAKPQTIANPASATAPNAAKPVNAASPTTAPVANPASAPSSATNIAAPSNVSAPTSPATSGVVPAEAPLAGDGSMAPMKSIQKFGPNDFGGVPPMPGTRKQLAVGEAPEVYDVEEGDTMFDVCSQLIDDGNYWPKLWSMNPDVKNPHFIYPGMKLAFYSGDLETPPFLEVVTEDEVVPVEKGGVNEVELIAEEVPVGGTYGGSDLSTVQNTSQKISGGLEDVSPVQIIGPGEIGAEGDALDGFIFGAKAPISDRLNFTVPAFIFEDEQDALGAIIGGQTGESVAGDDRKTYIEGFDGLGLGTYTILRPSGSVEGFASGDTVGARYEFVGNVRVFRQTKNGLYEGVVFDTHWGVNTGDIVVNFLATRRVVENISAIGPVATAESSVIGFDSNGKHNGGKGDVVFLEKQGLSVGAYYSVFKNDNAREIRHQRNSEVESESGSIAVVRVVDFIGNSAIAVIVSGNSEIKLGDKLSM